MVSSSLQYAFDKDEDIHTWLLATLLFLCQLLTGKMFRARANNDGKKYFLLAVSTLLKIFLVILSMKHHLGTNINFALLAKPILWRSLYIQFALNQVTSFKIKHVNTL